MSGVRPVQTVLSEPGLLLRWLPGATDRMVVVFTGAQAGFGGAPLDEFAASASVRGENAVLFVTDRRSSWYAAPGLWRRILRAIRTVRTSEGMREVVSLGNSMGGYAALLLPREMRVARAIAFAPQVSLDAAESGDTRWPDVARRWGPPPAVNVAATMAGTRTQYYVLAGGGCAEDMGHLALLPDLKRVHRYVLPMGRHNPAGWLKERGALGALVAALVRGRRARVERMLEAAA